jgi:hypothetical protein
MKNSKINNSNFLVIYALGSTFGGGYRQWTVTIEDAMESVNATELYFGDIITVTDMSNGECIFSKSGYGERYPVTFIRPLPLSKADKAQFDYKRKCSTDWTTSYLIDLYKLAIINSVTLENTGEVITIKEALIRTKGRRTIINIINQSNGKHLFIKF